VRQADAATKDVFDSEAQGLMEEAVGRGNMMAAWRRVRTNGGAPGVDGMTVEELWPWLHAHWSHVKVELLEDRYEPSPVRRVEIPKPGGKGMRKLGIPTVLDRLIQQALHQALSPMFDPGFSERSYGFRPGRSAHDAVKQARADASEGRRWVVDLDLEKFFDRVNHDVLMSRVARKVTDKRVLRLIRKYLRAGVMDGGVTSPTRARRRAGRCRRCCPTSCWMTWTRSWSDGGTRFVATPTTATFTCGRGAAGSGCWRR
jgi:RNA-directed DNA polymerase